MFVSALLLSLSSYDQVVTVARQLFENKKLVDDDGVEIQYSAWHASGDYGWFDMDINVPGFGVIQVQERLVQTAGGLEMVETLPFGGEPAHYKVTLGGRGGTLLTPAANAEPSFISSECWLEAGKTRCELKKTDDFVSN